jgi:hypothetical protein
LLCDSWERRHAGSCSCLCQFGTGGQGHRVSYRGRVEIGGSVPALKAGAYAYNFVLYGIDIVKGVGDGRAPSPDWANFSIMMECTPESGSATL